ncbi:hypothetical protein GOZ89_09540 [Agrobacterium vitis]|uniref:hypothetical protein n=1 Tax=Agrobacterium vitis TaxID=373 RepID=UPI000872B022|nr:hypothetical protein [Agrobacterium vitis]MCE6073637.1 hypothetical protein [Agrobacterium vitis]MCF1453654.1 hypothetical protein [Agrobacterium vitis]MCF1468445.1 hypothetical protein [Agrobacterium vitis]MCM2452251.1 hypothetical protein [Agrobacterium vitis]MCM2469570.1 hypothetical protein [Agrobacterium vitis]
MFASLTDPIKITVTIILGLAVGVLVMLVVYEGVRLPLIGQVISGRVANAVQTATENMVTTFERDALQAQLDAERRNREIAQAASAKAQERAAATEIARQDAEARIRDLQEQAKKDGLASWSEEELEWYGKH